MDFYLEEIIRSARLEIIDYNIETRRELMNYNRQFPYYVMSYLKEGWAVLELEGKVYKTGPGSIILIPANVRHRHYKEDSKPTTFLWWHFRFEISGVIDVLRLLDFPVLSYLKDKDKFEEVFERFYNSNKESASKISEYLMQRACSLELMACLTEEVFSEQNLLLDMRIPPAFWEIFRKIRAGEEEINLKNLAEEYHMSPTYISNRFKQFFGMAPIAMKNEILLEKAKTMLRNTELSVSEIAEQSGFVNLAGFTHFFTKRMNESPTAYRNHYYLERKK